MADWLAPYQDDIAALMRLDWEFMGSDAEDIAQRTREMADLLAPLLDHDLTPGDIETAKAAWWERFGAEDIRRAKREIALRRRLTPLYERLLAGSDDDWADYAHSLLDLRLNPDSPFLRMLLTPTPTDERVLTETDPEIRSESAA